MSTATIGQLEVSGTPINDPDNQATIHVRQLCEWSCNGDGFYDTACGNAHEFITDGPTENGYRYCPYCGKTLTLPPSHPPHP